MITCERCGTPIPNGATNCPTCGTVAPISGIDYGQRPSSSISYEYSQGYGQQPYPPQQPDYLSQPYSQSPGYAPQTGYPQQFGYAPQPNYPPQPGYGQAPFSAVNVNVSTVAPNAGRSGSGALVAEILLNIFLGVYGVGWLIAGETTAGVILLICSVLLYWPAVILSTIFTFGLGLVCIVPLEIGLIILNAILLNNTLKRNAQVVIVQTAITQQPTFYPRQ